MEDDVREKCNRLVYKIGACGMHGDENIQELKDVMDSMSEETIDTIYGESEAEASAAGRAEGVQVSIFLP